MTTEYYRPTFGLSVIVDDRLCVADWVQFRFPRSKRRRIRRKWGRRDRNWRPVATVCRVGDTLYVSPAMLAAIRKRVADRIEADLFAESRNLG